MDAKFEAAAQAVRECTKPAPDDDKLKLYGLFKQATVGDNTTGQPWAIQVEARAKWEAWTKEKGKAKDAAKEEYIERAAAFCQKYK